MNRLKELLKQECGYVPQDATLASFEDRVFSNCTALRTLEIPEGVVR